ncbi:MAG: elongation factor P--(R)-beta-lysine ligase [Treponemataceae bacterium]
MNIPLLTFKSDVAVLVRDFFRTKGYLEVDTPCFSDYIIPESSIEIFRTEQSTLQTKQYFLVPSPEVHIKKLLAECKQSLFSLSHCFRAGENTGRIHRPEFTMLEYYTVGADYRDSIGITEAFFSFLADCLANNPLFNKATGEVFRQPFLQLTMDEAFTRYAGFALSKAQSREALLEQVQKRGLNATSDVERYSYQDLYELVLVSCVEPQLPQNRIVALTDYPAVSETLSARKIQNGIPVTERWEIYLNGVELANCYTELTSGSEVARFFAHEVQKREESGMRRLIVPADFAQTCENLPRCSGVALGFERLLMLLSGQKTIEAFFAG